MTQRHDIVLRPAEGDDSPDLLREMLQDIKKLVPVASKSARKWITAKGSEAEARVREIQMRVYKEIAELDIQRQALIQSRDEAWQEAERQAQRDKSAHEINMVKLECQRYRERMQAVRQVVDCIVTLRELGVEIDLALISKAQDAMGELLDDPHRPISKLPESEGGDGHSYGVGMRSA